MTIFTKAYKWFVHIFEKCVAELQDEVLPFTCKFLNAVEYIVENPIAETVVVFFHNDMATHLFKKLKKALPSILEKLNLTILDLKNMDTVEELNFALTLICREIKWKTHAEKEQFQTTFGANLLQAATDGSMSFATAAMQLEYYFKHYYNSGREVVEPAE